MYWQKENMFHVGLLVAPQPYITERYMVHSIIMKQHEDIILDK